MLRHFPRARFTRQLVFILCPLLALSGPPLLALQENARFVPRQDHPAWLEPWLQADTWRSGWKSAVGLATGAGHELTTLLFAAAAQGAPPLPTPPQPASKPDALTTPALPDGKAITGGVPFAPGWNIVSLPTPPADPSPAAVLGDAAANVERLWVWDCATQAWKTYAPGDAASTLTALDVTQGVWLKGHAAGAIPSSGDTPTVTEIPLCAGWNQIGFPSVGPRHPRAALASIEGKYRRVFGYEPSDPQSPWRGLAALIAAFVGELSPDKVSKAGESFKKAADVIGDQWSNMTRRIAAHADTITAEASIDVLRRLHKYAKLQTQGRLKYVYYLPTGPGGRASEDYVPVSRDDELGVSIRGGRLFGFGIRTSRNNVDQVFRVDYWEHRQYDLHYHIYSIDGKPIP